MKPLLGLLAALFLAGPASAQIPLTTASGVGSFGGGFRPQTPALTAPVPMGSPFFHGSPFGGGFAPGYPFVPYTSFYGGFVPGFYAPYYVMPRSSIFDFPPPPPAAAPSGPPPRFVELSGESKATLTLTLPRPGSVWLDGKQLEGEPAREWVLSSPVLRQGEVHTLHVVAKWEVDGQKYQSEHKVAVRPGDRSKLGVLSGTAIK